MRRASENNNNTLGAEVVIGYEKVICEIGVPLIGTACLQLQKIEVRGKRHVNETTHTLATFIARWKFGLILCFDGAVDLFMRLPFLLKC